MKNLVLLAVVCALLSTTMADDLDFCTIYAGSSGFYLCPFTQTHPVTANKSLDTTFDGDITFSLVTAKVQDCDGSTDPAVYATYVPLIGDCVDIATHVHDPIYDLIQSDDPSQGLNITYPAVQDSDGNWRQLVVLLGCDVTQDDAASTSFVFNTTQVESSVTINGTVTAVNNYTYIVTGASKYGCPVFSLQKIIQFLQNNQTAFCVVLGVLGVALTFFGLKFFRFAVFTIVTILGTLVTGSIFFQFTSLGSEEWVLWSVFGVSVIVGVVLGVLAVKLEKVGFFLVGAALGATGGLMLYNAILLPALGAGSGTAPLYITLLVAGVIAGIIGIFIFESILIIATSLIGSYLIVRVISVYAGGFPNEAYVAENLEKFDKITYAYLAGILVLSIIGMVIQFKRRASREDKEDGGDKQANYAYYRY